MLGFGASVAGLAAGADDDAGDLGGAAASSGFDLSSAVGLASGVRLASTGAGVESVLVLAGLVLVVAVAVAIVLDVADAGSTPIHKCGSSALTKVLRASEVNAADNPNAAWERRV